MPKGIYPRKTRENKTVRPGEKYSRWTVVAASDKRRYFECVCECGNTKSIRDDSLLNGQSGSCGCLAAEIHAASAVERFTTHGLSGSKVWTAHKDMVGRCYNPKFKNFKTYGALGVTVCDRWRGKGGFMNFVEDMGLPQEGDTLERESVQGNYEPLNCKWEPSLSIQGYNKRLLDRNSSGKTGVRRSYNAWQAYINKDGQFYNLGRFVDFEDAVRARREGELKHYGFYQEDVPHD